MATVSGPMSNFHRRLGAGCLALLFGGCASSGPHDVAPRSVAPSPQARVATPTEPRPQAPRPAAAVTADPVSVPAPVAESQPAVPRFEQPLVEPEETRAVVLLYHAFDRGTAPLSVRSRNFEKQLRWLQAEKVEIVHTSELLEFLEGSRRLPKRVAVITIDDGLKSVFEKAWPILKQLSVKFTLGLPTGVMEDPKNAPVMTWDQVRVMTASGLCEIASHGHMHRRLVGLEGRRLFEELELSRQIIQRQLGSEPVAYFYPLGAYDTRSAGEVEKRGYRAGFRASGAPVALGASSSFWIPRTSVFHDDGAHIGYYFSQRFLSQVRAVPVAKQTAAKDAPHAPVL